jgi:hypothetical protein
LRVSTNYDFKNSDRTNPDSKEAIDGSAVDDTTAEADSGICSSLQKGE